MFSCCGYETIRVHTNLAHRQIVKYALPKAGEWIQPIRRGYKMACCDCGLVHTLDFKTVGTRSRRIQFRVFRNNRATAAVRRHMG